MKEELQGKLVEILTSIQTAAGKASDFAMEQLPDIAQSYVMYGRAVNTLWLVLGVALFLLAAFRLGPNAMSAAQRGEDKDMPVFAVNALGAVVGGVVGFIMAAEHMSSALMVWFAPKVWLLKEIATLIK
jgi:Na+/proline symporter